MTFSNQYMTMALEQARAGAVRGEVPVGAVVVCDGRIIACASNRVIELRDPSAHAELLAIRMACQIMNSERLPDCDLYVTLEPCPMCAHVISLARIRRLYFGAYDHKSGGVDNGPRIFHASSCHHRPEVYGGIGEQAAAQLLTDFFQQRR